MKRLLNHRTGIFLLLLAAFFVSNWRYEAREVFRPSSQKVDWIDQEDLRVDNNFKELDIAHFSVAGFPFRYWEKSEFDGQANSHIYGNALALNLLIWALVLGAFLAYEIYQARSLAKRVDANPKEINERRLGLADLMVLTGIIAVAVGYWRWSINASTSEETLAAQIRSSEGIVVQSLILPDIVSQRLPATWHADLKRLSEVALLKPSPELIDKVVKLPYLNHLTIDGGEGDLMALEQLKSRPLFISLRIMARNLTEREIKTIASLTQLQSLAICRSTLTDESLNHFANLPRLQLLSVEDTEVTLKNIASLPCAKGLRMLNLSRPEAGQSGELTLSNLPELKWLACKSIVRKPNHEPMKLSVTDLPKLEKITLDNLQLFDLTLDKLPQLSFIEGRRDYWTLRMPQGGGVNASPCLSRLAIGDLPKLDNLSLFAPALNELTFSAPINCSFCLDSSIVRSANIIVGGIHTPVPPNRVQRWVDAFATSLGPKQVEFRNLNLCNTNFTAFSKNNRIEILRFVDCEIDAAQVGALRGMPNIEVLGFGQSPLTGPQIEALAGSLPKLLQIECDASQVTRLKLENLPALRSVFSRRNAPTQPLEALRLVHVPNLIENFDLPPNLFFLHVEDAPSISHFTTSGLWPAKAVFKGLRDLKVFSASGTNLNDGLIDELVKCEKLEQLTLTDHEISPAALARLGSLSRLQSLALSGTKLDDTAMEGLVSLKQLTNLNLDRTAITERSLAAIAKLTVLEKLSIADTSMSMDALSQLSSMTQLRELNCSGTKLTEEATRGLASIKSLRVLDLSNMELNAATLTPIGQLTSLERLKLVDSRVDSRALMSLADQSQALQFELSNSAIDRDAFDMLRSSRRLWTPQPEEGLPRFFGTSERLPSGL